MLKKAVRQMANNMSVVVDNPLRFELYADTSFQKETSVRVFAKVYNMFKKKVTIQWEIYPTAYPNEKVIYSTSSIAADTSKQFFVKFTELNPNTKYTVIGRVTNLSEASGGTVIGELWKTASCSTIIMSRTLSTYKKGTSSYTVKLSGLTKYPYDRVATFLYKKKGEKDYRVSGQIDIKTGEKDNRLHLYSGLQPSTDYIFLVEIYRKAKNKRISWLSISDKTATYVPGGLPVPYQGEILIVPETEACKVQVMWDGDLPQDTFVIGLKAVEESEDVWVWVPIRDKNNNVYRLTTPGQWITFASQYEEDAYKLAVARYVNGEYVQLYTTDPIDVAFTFLPGEFTYRNKIQADYVLDFANAFVCLHDFLILDETDVSEADEIYNALLEKRASIEAGSPVEGGEDCIFASMILLSNLWLGTNIAEWENLSEQPVNLTALDNIAQTISHAFWTFIDRW